MPAKYLLIFLVYSASCSSQDNEHQQERYSAPTNNAALPSRPENVKQIALPKGYQRLSAGDGSFQEYLHGIRIKKDKTVYLYNGDEKKNQSAQYAVLDIPVGSQDLQQCADAVMRLRAEYLFSTQRFEQIVFTDNEGKSYQYKQPYTRANLDRYLLKVFGMCGSASLSKQLQLKDINSLAAGDVFIRGGFPGHAVIVIDVAVNDQGKKIFMLAQSYMPAQDIHILLNPVAEDGMQPWYKVDDIDEELVTPEYTFKKVELKTWR